MNPEIPSEAPPAYSATASDHLQVPSAAAASSAGAESGGRHRRTSSAGSTASSNYTTDEERYEESGNGIPEEVRRDMLDESRPLPDGWRREFDANSGHYFYVDTKAKPPRSIWSHPLDPDFLKAHPNIAEKVDPALSSSQSDSHAAEKDQHNKLHKPSSHASTSTSGASTSQSHGHGHGQEEDKRTFGRKMKDKLTGTTHEQRVEQRRKQAEQEKKEYEAYLRRRAQIRQAQAEGRYQPMYGAPMGPYVRTVPMGYGGGMYGGGMYGGGMYGRPYYGNGIGMGRAGMGTGMALGGGLLGGLLLGDMLF
ncbi:hypothetical protein JCM10908_003066 [Rhodotorula pacifica]|uniref:uncharacterized protein n=1 Tax=Rhodotorula pacifica TaxID=1495444 RepID=UPI00316F4227